MVAATVIVLLGISNVIWIIKWRNKGSFTSKTDVITKDEADQLKAANVAVAKAAFWEHQRNQDLEVEISIRTQLDDIRERPLFVHDERDEKAS